MSPKKRKRATANGRQSYWLLQDAKARFSELIRKVRSEGPQHVIVRGRDEVVIIAAEEYRRLKGEMTGEAHQSDASITLSRRQRRAQARTDALARSLAVTR